MLATQAKIPIMPPETFSLDSRRMTYSFLEREREEFINSDEILSTKIHYLQNYKFVMTIC